MERARRGRGAGRGARGGAGAGAGRAARAAWARARRAMSLGIILSLCANTGMNLGTNVIKMAHNKRLRQYLEMKEVTEAELEAQREWKAGEKQRQKALRRGAKKGGAGGMLTPVGAGPSAGGAAGAGPAPAEGGRGGASDAAPPGRGQPREDVEHLGDLHAPGRLGGKAPHCGGAGAVARKEEAEGEEEARAAEANLQVEDLDRGLRALQD